ncbi:DUF1302 family protein [Neptuniibacter sp. CAU 1671]|uniref:DUF1302 family protein n=1 Tax=Neptuniibacter sp. CAU 1671 TaxID=3032593 RepID=UPI0023DABDCA|nr:DUF1302 family protein [Neptuniibacter sp. CAU 1671]MDF2180560.1 DUF1302 domain-containing protein [Neptuniibacter sp. CAU 1671]
MSKKITTTYTRMALAISAAVVGGQMATTATAAETTWAGFVENATYYRDDVGLSKFRNTAQAEFEKKLESETFRSLSINGVLRGTYDGVYDLNDKDFGKDAQESHLGANWHDADLSNMVLAPGTPFPCENDPALCNNLDGYMDQHESDAAFPEFNDQLDFVRELYVRGDLPLDNGDVFSFSLGKQQIIWGKTDLFRVLDVLNPVDYSRHNIYDELEDIRIPQWMLNATWRMGATETFDDINLSFVWNFDKFRPSNLGTCGQSYSILDAGCFFSSRINGGGPYVINDVEEPSWSLANTQFGVKWEGVYGDATFSLNALHFRQQLPSLHALPGPGDNFGLFNIEFPRVNLVGGAIDYYSMDMDAVWRLELAYTQGEELARDLNGHKETDMLRYVIGFDKNLVMPSLGTQSAFLISAQLFGEHILDHVEDMPNEEDNWIATLLFKGWYMNNRLSPQIIMAHDFGGKATAVAPSISWTPDNHWMFNLGLNVKFGGDETFGWSPVGGEKVYEPLARFTNGPIGVANQEDEIQLTVRYSF